jgi:hypothetical protein
MHIYNITHLWEMIMEFCVIMSEELLFSQSLPWKQHQHIFCNFFFLQEYLNWDGSKTNVD